MIRPVAALLALAIALPVAAQTAPPEKAKPERSKLICRTYAETGSLIARRKVCKTAVEWRNEAQDIQSLNENKVCVGAQCTGAPPG